MISAWKMTWTVVDAKRSKSKFSIYVEDTGQTGTFVEIADTVTATLKTVFSGAVVSCSVSAKIVPPTTQFDAIGDAEINSDVEEGGVIHFDDIYNNKLFSVRLPTLKEEYYSTDDGIVITDVGTPLGFLSLWMTVLDFPSDVYDSGVAVSSRGEKLQVWRAGKEKFIPR